MTNFGNRLLPYQNCQASRLDVLLVPEVLVGCNEGIEFRFSCPEEGSIVELGPPHLLCCRDGVLYEGVTQRCGNPLVKENFHSCLATRGLGDGKTFLRMSQDKFHLLARHPWKPLQEIIYASASFEVFEKCSHRHPCILEHPSPLTFPGTCSIAEH